MLAADDLDALWVVGANPLKDGPLASKKAFVVVQDMFLTETAQRADVVLPAASAYEKNGTVTNVCGEVQRLKRAISTIGAKPDLEIIGLIAKEMGLAAQMGPWLPETVYNEIRRTVKGYDIPLALVTVGAQQTTPVNGRVGVESRPDLIWSAHDNLFTSGTLGRYSKILNSVIEKRLTQAHPDKEEYVRLRNGFSSSSPLIKIALIAFVLPHRARLYLQWVERKVIAHVQVRMGPSRVGPHGLLQPLADVIKLITKEGVMPPHVNRFFYLLAPFLAVFMALISISVIPFGTQLTVGPYTTVDAAGAT